MMLLYHVSFPFGKYSHWKHPQAHSLLLPGTSALVLVYLELLRLIPLWFLTNTLTLGAPLSCLSESYSSKGC